MLATTGIHLKPIPSHLLLERVLHERVRWDWHLGNQTRSNYTILEFTLNFTGKYGKYEVKYPSK